MSSIILAGGHGSRLGQDKSFLVVAGERLLQRTVDRLSQLDEEIILVLAQGQADPQLRSPRGARVETARDLYHNKGPLVGIYSGLKVSSQDYGIAVACDMPFLNIELLRYMASLIPGFEIVIPRIGHMVEPLHAVYSKNCLQSMEGMMKEGNLKLDILLKRVRVRYLEETEIDLFDPERLSFFNINTPDDLVRAEQIMSRRGCKK